MKTILFAWELGSGLGHAVPLIALADKLVSRNERIRPVFAFRETIYTRRLIPGHDWPVIPAPLAPAPRGGETGDASYAQILMSVGFNRPADLEGSLATWDDLLKIVDPDLIVVDHSPFACLAARGRYPLLVTGTAFTVPPSDTRNFPPFRRGAQPPALQTRMVAVINAVLSARGQPPLVHLPELVAGDRRAIFSLPHLDPYGSLRTERLLGPYLGRIAPVAVPDAPSIYLYSRAEEERLDAMVDVLLELNVPISAFVGGPECVATLMLQNRGATVFQQPPDLAHVLGEARLVISHGGAGVVTAALSVGRAQVIVPIHVESEVTAARVASTGAALALTPFDKEKFREAVETVMQVRLFHEHAANVAREIAALDLPADPLGEAAAMAESVL